MNSLELLKSGSPSPALEFHEHPEVKSQTPVSDTMELVGENLNQISKYKSNFDFGAYRKLEKRFSGQAMRGGFVMKTDFRLANSHSTCQQCLYSFEIDTYGRGCIHNCVYCYAKAELTVHGMWNNPIPVPIDINSVRKAFYTTFETTKKHKFREILERKIPLRIGSMSDSFMASDKIYKVTQELIKLLNFYEYPHIVFTRSDLVAEDEYLKLLNPKHVAVQFSMSSTNDEITKLIEPGAPSPSRRLAALRKLSENEIWTTVRINPLFPTRPDGFFTDDKFTFTGQVPELNISDVDMIDEIADHKVPAILVGFGRFSGFALNALSKSLEIDFRSFFRRDLVEKSARDYHYSDREIQFYYNQFHKRALAQSLQFSTCYIGNGEDHFWSDQPKWTNKLDCCNAKGRVASFGTDAREIPFATRLKFASNKNQVSLSERLHEPLVEAPKAKRAPRSRLEEAALEL